MQHLELIRDATKLLLFLEATPVKLDAGQCPRCLQSDTHADDCELRRVLEQLSAACDANVPPLTEDQLRRRAELKQANDEAIAELDRILAESENDNAQPAPISDNPPN